MNVGIVTGRSSETNVALAARSWAGSPARVLSPRDALLSLSPNDVAIGRIDVRDSLDGVEEGCWELERLAEAGTTILNPPAALLACHDKLVTARKLRRAGLPHPSTVHVEGRRDVPELDFPLVLKPRFGSWGRDVELCRDARELARCLERLSFRPWFRAHGAIAQELVRPVGHDLRIVVAGGEVVGAARRLAAAGEWRTNVALGATRVPTIPPPVAVELACRAAHAVDADLVGVDLLPLGPGSFCVLELNGAVDFTRAYSLGGDVFQAAAAALIRVALEDRRVSELRLASARGATRP